jgi:inner membrane protein
MMAVLLLGLLVPVMMIYVLVGERAGRRDAATAEIGAIWGGPQTLAGPVLTVPYRCAAYDVNGRATECLGRVHFLPDVLGIDVVADPEIRQRSLFEVVVYRSRLSFQGRFAKPDLSGLRPAPEEFLWDQATVSVGVSEPKGIARRPQITLAGVARDFHPGIADVGLFASGLHVQAGFASAPGEAIPFAFDLEVNGTRALSFVPAGSETAIRLTSSWRHPSFVGAALPRQRTGDAAGFAAEWSAPSFGRSYPARWTSHEISAEQLRTQAQASAFGVVLLRPVDIYQQTERAVKYAVLFIVLTFVIAFLWEIVGAALVHPVQYLFVGFALCVFYLLLLSLSEHIGFDRAYTIASGATVGLLGWYWSWVLGGTGRGTAMALTLACLYGFLYLLLRLEDYALLAGSAGLFLMLFAVMFLTRRINWYTLRLGGGGASA